MHDKDDSGLLMIGIPDETYELIRKVAKKKQMRPAEAFSDALRKYAMDNLTPEERGNSLGEEKKLLID